MTPFYSIMTAPAHEKPAGVSSIELFFDLVFVFVITQVTQLVEHAHGALAALAIAVLLIERRLETRKG